MMYMIIYEGNSGGFIQIFFSFSNNEKKSHLYFQLTV